MFEDQIKSWLEEDGVGENAFYEQRLPVLPTRAFLYVKEDMILCGLPFFCEVFDVLSKKKLDWKNLLEFEGKKIKEGTKIELPLNLPFNIMLNGERLALNLLQRASSVGTYTDKLCEKASAKKIKILDTRKTTPGLRQLEKYAVRMGGGYNHRMRQNDAWMIKDNHKNFFGGIKQALDYFHSLQSFYTPIIVEIHSLVELKEAISLGANHVMLDNFNSNDLIEAVKLKEDGMTYEVSGGVNVENVDIYLIPGIDAISSGALTHSAPAVDLSLKYERC